MGADPFTEFHEGHDLNETFRIAVAMACHESGHGGYTGTLAEKGDVIQIQTEPLSREEAEHLADQMIERDDPRIQDKWGPAGALPVCLPYRTVEVIGLEGDMAHLKEIATAHLHEGKHLAAGESVLEVTLVQYEEVLPLSRYGAYGGLSGGPSAPRRFRAGRARVRIQRANAPTRRQATVTVTVPGDPKEGVAQAACDLAISTKALLQPGETVIGTQVISGHWDGATKAYVGGPRPTYKVEVEVPKDETLTRYVVKGSMDHGDWPRGLPSQAEARAHAVDLAKRTESPGSGSTQYAVVSETRRASGAALLTVIRCLIKTEADVEVTIQKESVGGKKTIDGWVFFGWASS